MALRIGQTCQTPDGIGVVRAKEPFGNGPADYRLGVKHERYPEHRTKGLYRDDVLYYFPRELEED